MKKILHLLLLGLLILTTQNVSAQWAGAGTLINPYQISDTAGLRQLSNGVKGGNQYSNTYFILTNNIDMSGVINFIPIGGWNSTGAFYSESNYFNGNFNGNGNIIRNLTILKDSTNTNNQYIGLFGYIGSTGTIKNIGVKGLRMRGYQYIGGLCGMNNGGLITNCFTDGLVTGRLFVGGLIGENNNAQTRNSYTKCDVLGYQYVGGFEGEDNQSSVYNCYSSGNVTGTLYCSGFSYKYYGYADYIYFRQGALLAGSTGNTEPTSKTIAEMASPAFVNLLNTDLSEPAFISDCNPNINQGYPILVWQTNDPVAITQDPDSVTNVSAILEGLLYSSNDTIIEKGFYFRPINQTYFDTLISSTIGASITYNKTNLIQGSIYEYMAYAKTSSQTYYGDTITFTTLLWAGLGTLANPYEISDTAKLIYFSKYVNSQNPTLGKYFKLTNDIDMSGVTTFNPIAGWNVDGQTTNADIFFNGNFDGNGKVISNLTILKDSTNSSKEYVGLFGRVGASGVVKNLGLRNIRIRGYQYVGAICGRIDDGNIRNCYSSGIVGGDNIVGGLCGYCDGGTIEGSYSLVNVFGNSYVGGFAGAFYYATSINNYSVGNVKGNTYVCGFAHTTWGVSSNLYFRNGNLVSGSIGNEAGHPKTMVEMQDISFVTLINTGLNPVAFKADVQMLNNGFPLLVWQEVNPIMTKQSNNITATTATVYGLITETGVTFDSIGFYYRESISNLWHSVIGNYMGNNNISANLVSLNPNTNYEFMAYMAKDTNVYLGDTLYFTTLHLPIKISTDSVLFVSSSSVKLYGYANIGSHNLNRKGFEYKKASDAIFTNVVNLLDASDTLENTVIGLSLNTSYTFRAFIESEQGIEYGNNMNFIIFESGLGKPEKRITKISLYPNPTIDQAKLQLSGIDKEIRLIIIDIQGRVIKDQIIKSTNNSINTIIDLSQEPKGMYYIKLQNNNINKTEKIIKM